MIPRSLPHAAVTGGAVLFLLLAPPTGDAQEPVPQPADVFGFEPGTDYRLADHDQILTYFEALAGASDRMELRRIGESVRGRPMVMAVISSPESLAELDRYREINRRLARARDLDDEEARRLSREGKVTVWINSGLHSIEVAHAQHAPELAFELVTRETPKVQRIRQEAILLLVPVMNPDGQDLVVDWYRSQRDTPFETTRLPEIYHHYAGHSINRDWQAYTQPESRAASDVFYREWYPQIVYDHHQTGPFPGRIWVPPAIDPLNPHLDPVIAASHSMLGQYMKNSLLAEGKEGVTSGIGYSVAWSSAFLHGSTKFRNTVGIFTETQSYYPGTATPYEEDLEEDIPEFFFRGIPLRAQIPSMHNPRPWLGGRWGLREQMDYIKAASYAALDAATRMGDQFLYNRYDVGRRQIERGRNAEGGPFAHVIDLDAQHDVGNAVELLRALQQGGVEVHRADRAFEAGGQRYPEGAYVIPPQAFRPAVLDLLEPKVGETGYPEEFGVHPRDPMRQAEPVEPYEQTGYELSLQMGVEVDRVDEPFELPGDAVTEEIPVPEPGIRGEGDAGFLVAAESNGSATLINRLHTHHAGNAAVHRLGGEVELAGRRWSPGTVFVEGLSAAAMEEAASGLGVEVFAAARLPEGDALEPMEPPRVGLYRSYVPNIPEGWTRWVLDTHEFEYETLHDEDVREGGLADRFDIIVLPEQAPEDLLKGHEPGTMPTEYTGGLGSEGGAALDAFVREGGWLLGIHRSNEFIADQLGLPVENRVAGADSRDFFVPGTLVHLDVDADDPLGRGVRPRAVATLEDHAVVLEVVPAAEVRDLEEPRDETVYARYAEDELLASGWEIGGDEHMAGRAAALRLSHGDGQVVMLGFRPAIRGHPRNTFRFLFNPILDSALVRDGS